MCLDQFWHPCKLQIRKRCGPSRVLVVAQRCKPFLADACTCCISPMPPQKGTLYKWGNGTNFHLPNAMFISYHCHNDHQNDLSKSATPLRIRYNVDTPWNGFSGNWPQRILSSSLILDLYRKTLHVAIYTIHNSKQEHWSVSLSEKVEL